MKEKELRRSLAVLPIGTVMKLTNLSARQIRYYEEQGLITPERNAGNRRMFSLNDVDRLLEIKDYLADGINMAGIKEIYVLQQQKDAQKQADLARPLTDNDVRQILHDEFLNLGDWSPSKGPITLRIELRLHPLVNQFKERFSWQISSTPKTIFVVSSRKKTLISYV